MGKWINISNPKNNEDLGLGKSEKAALNLAKESKNDLITDDASAVKTAKTLDINITE
jgi:predicted nucleic acid-binding protein